MNKIYLLRADAGEILYTLVIEMRIAYSFAIKIYQLIRSKNYRGTVVKESVIGESLNDDFGAYAVNITTTNSYNRFLCCTHIAVKIQREKQNGRLEFGSFYFKICNCLFLFFHHLPGNDFALVLQLQNI